MRIVRDKMEWNEIVLRRNGSFLQSFEWGKLQRELGKNAICLLSENERVACLAILQKTSLGMNYWYVPHGPLFMHTVITEDISAFLEYFRKDEYHARPFMVRVDLKVKYENELLPLLKETGFLQCSFDIQPTHTIHVDLTKQENELYASIEKDTRYAIRTALRRGVAIKSFHTTEEKEYAFPIFWKIFETMNAQYGLSIYSKKYYQQVSMLSGECYSDIYIGFADDGKPISAAIIIHFGNVASYLYAASLREYRHLNASSCIVWSAMRDAKLKKKTIFDFWGISDSKKTWSGFTHFKRGFGGTEERFAGALDYPLRPVSYRAYSIIKKMLP